MSTSFIRELKELDPYFINALLEHWYHSLVTYFPARGTLGYSHGLVLYAPFYIAVRPFTDPFLAYTLTLFLMMMVGACCLYLLCRRLTLGPIESLLVSAFFWTSPNVISGYVSVWAQSASVFLIPPILLVAMIAAGMRDGWPRVVLAWLAGFLAALLLIQDSYTAQFALLVTVLLLLGVRRARADARGRRGRVACRGRGVRDAHTARDAGPGRAARGWSSRASRSSCR